MTRLTPPKACIACGTQPRRSLRLTNEHALLRCPKCGLGWWEWADFEPAELYGQGYFQSAECCQGYNDYAALEPGLRRTARDRLERIDSVGPGWDQSNVTRPARRLLDIGCGTGVFLDEAVQFGWEVEGLEVSEYAANVARRRNLRVQSGAIETANFAAASYDCITLWDVIEHLRDPAGVLASAAAALRPGGVLALSTGDLNATVARLSGRRWHLFTLPEHLFFFTTASLRALLARVGLTVARVTREVYWAPLGYLVERLAKMFGRPAPPSCQALNGIILPATLFDVIGIYAVRRAARQAGT